MTVEFRQKKYKSTHWHTKRHNTHIYSCIPVGRSDAAYCTILHLDLASSNTICPYVNSYVALKEVITLAGSTTKIVVFDSVCPDERNLKDISAPKRSSGH